MCFIVKFNFNIFINVLKKETMNINKKNTKYKKEK